jgi:hypothetical protein
MTYCRKLTANKKIRAAVFFLTLLLSAMAEAHLVNVTSANPNMFKTPRYCNISIQSPQNGTTYNVESVILNFTVKKGYVSDTYSFFYLVDSQDIQSGAKVEDMQLVGEETITEAPLFPYTETTLSGQVTLPKLDNGQHNLTVFVGWIREDGVIFHANLDPFSSTAYFSVDTAVAPTPSPSSSPQEPEIEPEPFPTTSVIATAASAAIASAAVLVYFNKRKARQFSWKKQH